VIVAVVVGRYVGQWLSAPDPIGPVDAIVVTSGATDQRVPAAVDLVRRGVASRLVVVVSSGGPILDERGRIRDYAVKAGVADRSLSFVAAPTSVLAESRIAAATLTRSHLDIDDVAVIAAPPDIARVRLAFSRSLNARVRVWSDGSPYDGRHWLRGYRMTTVAAAAKTAAMLAVLGPVPTSKGAHPPASVPLRAFAGALVGAAIAGAGCRRLAHRLGLVSVPRLWRAHASPTPMLGGLAVLAGIFVGGLAAGGIDIGGGGAVAVGAGLVLALALIGLVDDIAGVGPRTRLLWAALAGLTAWFLGVRVQVFAPGAASIGDGALTLLWFVGITHAVNLLDHIDGATAAVCAASAATIAAVGAAGGQFVVTAAAAAVAGACLGYLVHNFPPARLFMGDMGALAIGFALAALALGLRPTQVRPVSGFVAVLALGVPIFDTTVVTVSRIRAGRSPLVGGTDHVSHRLRARGVPVRTVIGMLAGAQLVLGVIAFGIASTPVPVAWTLVALTAVGVVTAFVFFLRQPEWTPPSTQALSHDVRIALARAVDAIAMFEEVAESTGLAGADPSTMRALREGAKRLDAIQTRVGRAEPESP